MDLIGLLTALVTVVGPPLVQAWTARRRRDPDREMAALQEEIGNAATGTPTDRAVLLDRVLDRAKTRRHHS